MMSTGTTDGSKFMSMPEEGDIGIISKRKVNNMNQLASAV